MTEQQRIRDAIADIDNALKDHRDFGPYYDDKELNEITAQREQLRGRLQLTEQEKP